MLSHLSCRTIFFLFCFCVSQNICRNATNFTVAIHAVKLTVVGMEQLGSFVQLIIVAIYAVTVLFDFIYLN